MQTTVKYVETYSRPASAIRPQADLETRLALAAAGMDAILAHRHGDALADAGRALRDADAAFQAAVSESLALAPEPVTFEPHPALAKARQIIETRGWHRGSFESPDGAVCAWRAIQLAVGHGGDEDGPCLELLNRIAIETGNPATSIQGWNDSCTEVGQVMRLLW